MGRNIFRGKDSLGELHDKGKQGNCFRSNLPQIEQKYYFHKNYFLGEDVCVTLAVLYA